MAFYSPSDLKRMEEYKERRCRRCTHWHRRMGRLYPTMGDCQIRGRMTRPRMAACDYYKERRGGWRNLHLTEGDLKAKEERILKQKMRRGWKHPVEGRLKYFARKDGMVAGIRYRKANVVVGHAAELVIGGAKLEEDIVIQILDVLFVNDGGYEARGYKSVAWQGKNRYKPRAHVVGVSEARWEAFLKNLEARGFVINPVRSFGRLMR